MSHLFVRKGIVEMSCSIENIRGWFKNHEATLIESLEGGTQTLIWGKPETREGRINFNFFENMLFVSGDYRCAIFDTTWKTSWDCQKGWRMDLDYFFGKLKAHSDGKHDWDSEVGISAVKKHYAEYFEGEFEDEESNEKAYNELIGYVSNNQKDYYSQIEDACDLEYRNEIPFKRFMDEKALLQMCIVLKHLSNSSNEEEYAYGLQNDGSFEDFNDFWEWGYHLGRVMNKDIEVYLIALQMAYDQLKAKQEKEAIKEKLI